MRSSLTTKPQQLSSRALKQKRFSISVRETKKRFQFSPLVSSQWILAQTFDPLSLLVAFGHPVTQLGIALEQHTILHRSI